MVVTKAQRLWYQHNQSLPTWNAQNDNAIKKMQKSSLKSTIVECGDKG